MNINMDMPKKKHKQEIDPLQFKAVRKGEFGKVYEVIIPSEAEVRFIGNRLQRCYYYMQGLEICKYEMLSNKNGTFLPCKTVLDAMWGCFTDHKYGDTLEQIPESARPHRQKFFDCYFQPHLGLEFCMKHFTDMVRTIYRQPGHKLNQYF